jgi:simple sugar transport system ATP-binding protein
VSSRAPLVSVRDIAKRFGSVEALRNVRMSVDRGEVLALLGDNGAGKSTLIKILSGLYPPDRGELRWEGERVRFRSPRDAQERGIATVYQDLAVCDQMSIYRNVVLGREDDVSRGIGPIRWIDRGRARREARDALAAVGIQIRSADEPVGQLSGGERQSIAIARGVHFSASLLILDEPTSALSIKQSARVLKSIEAAREAGLAVIVISHNVHHVLPVADRYAVLSRGSTIAEFGRGERTKEEISDLIVEGRLLEQELDRAEASQT